MAGTEYVFVWRKVRIADGRNGSGDAPSRFKLHKSIGGGTRWEVWEVVMEGLAGGQLCLWIAFCFLCDRIGICQVPFPCHPTMMEPLAG